MGRSGIRKNMQHKAEKAKASRSTHITAVAKHLDEHIGKGTHNPQRYQSPSNHFVHLPFPHWHCHQ